MCRRILVLAFVFSLAATANAGQTAATRPALESKGESRGRLPVKRVVLYKNGVGYFEHTARVHGNQDLNIDFTTAQLNDVLKSLTVVDLGEGRITGVRFNSLAPLSERLKGLRLPLGEDVSRHAFLEALRGTRLEVRNGSASASGKLLSVETQKRVNPKGESLAEITEVSLVTDGGELRSFDVEPATSVRIADRELSDEVGRYLNLIGSANAVDLRRMTISASGSGDRDLFVSYISEVPVWKSTYRVLLPDKPGAKPLMQGWAVVDNTIGEDWNDVQLSLVAGAPQSFVQQISQPYYVRRPVIALPQSVMLEPQTHEAGMEYKRAAAPPPPPGATFGVGASAGMVGGVLGGVSPGRAGLQGFVKDQSGAAVPNARVTVRNEQTGASQSTTTNNEGFYRFTNIQPGNSAVFVEMAGFSPYALTNIYLGVGRMNEIQPTLEVGHASQEVTVTAANPTLNTSTARISSAVETEGSEAEGKEIGELFEYDLKQKVTIGKNQSALVPILQSRIDAEKVTLWNSEDSGPARRALWLTNNSGSTLDAGSFNVLDAETFAGEGMLDTIHPGEKRLISYAADPAVRVKEEEDDSEKPVSRVRINKGLMILTKEQREKKTYKVSNSDDSPRDVVIEHPAREGWKFAGNLKPEESSASFHRFRVKVAPKKLTELVVEEFHPELSQIELSNLTGEEVALLVEQKRVTPEMMQAFQRILGQKTAIGSLEAKAKGRQQEVDAINADQARIRENMKALKGSAEEKALLQRYTQQLDSQEDRLAALRNELSDLRAKRDAARQALDQALAEISVDETF